MKFEDVKVGMKVVPHGKSVPGYCNFDECEMWNAVKDLDKPYLVVSSLSHHSVHSAVWLKNEINSGYSTSYFPSDFEPYIEDLTSETLTPDLSYVEHTPDMVNSPAHYASGSIECYDALAVATADLKGEECGCTWNTMKYLWRWKRKGGVEDLKKAQWYLNKLIEIAK